MTDPFKMVTLEDSIAFLRKQDPDGEHRKIPDRMEKRRCDDCTFCCTAKGIKDMKPEAKEPWTSCRELCGKGCAIYDSPEKPETCRDYYCAWRLGIGGDLSRPDKTGVMIDVELLEEINPDTGSPFMGLVFHTDGPFKMIPARRAIDDARAAGIYHVGFVTADEDRKWTKVKYMSDGRDILPCLSRVAGTGKTGWNLPSKGPEDSSQDASEIVR